MEHEFDLAINKEDFCNACRLYHGTTLENARTIENEGICLDKCRQMTDFTGVL